MDEVIDVFASKFIHIGGDEAPKDRWKGCPKCQAYGFNPVAGLSSEQAKHVLGLQANFWSHIDREPELVDKRIFPRLH